MTAGIEAGLLRKFEYIKITLKMELCTCKEQVLGPGKGAESTNGPITINLVKTVPVLPTQSVMVKVQLLPMLLSIAVVTGAYVRGIGAHEG